MEKSSFAMFSQKAYNANGRNVVDKHKVIVITGATRGLGRAMASQIASLGHTVIGCGRSEAAIDTLMTELGTPHRFDVVDVTRDGDVATWAASVIKDFGPPDLLMNNAALINSVKPLWQMSAQDFDPVIDVNIKGVANVVRHFVPAMIERQSGVIVNFSSGWGRGTDSGVAPYCTTKWAIEGLTRSLAQELPKNMAAIPLNPGIIDTDMLKICFGDEAKHYPSAERWAEIAVPFLLKLSASDNGRPLSVPGY
ncbi:SDR family NAD(P)-dependent oxidoreductase [Methylomarinum sp. Ch1-1]|uniref:SDR family NAD(P)-dependent oxidoreductase n=1 Tax=Methylomarinum roseum TaxID=3067653 RepID=A0AAU7NTZ8_9GAMM|nr:SDR family NAD(P)-dependent oxidoreductase [Methylomarinum sp. Ch1-1]MDP4519420.1 SDR family NAD(P)-dependent oxidoreductase [Methylomarinum sp. Ch1-1]